MAEQELIFDLFTLFGNVPPRAEAPPGGVEGLQAAMARQRIGGAATVATRAVFADAAGGNRATLEACQAAGGRLVPAAVLDPRFPLPLVGGKLDIGAARLLCILPATQNYPLPYAPLGDCLRGAQASGLPVYIEASRPGDATAIGVALREIGYAGAPVLLGDVTGPQLTEALSVARASDRMGLTTNGLTGVGEVGYAVSALGAARVFFASGAPIVSMGAAVAMVKLAGLEPTERAQVFGGNALRLLGLGGAAAG